MSDNINSSASDAAPKPISVSYSLLSLFKNCRKATEFKYNRGLRSLVRPSTYALNFGNIFHVCLEEWYTNKDLNKVYTLIDSKLPSWDINLEEKIERANLRAMIRGYAKQYENEEFEVISGGLEKDFHGPITDMDTLNPIPGVEMVGRIDGLVKNKENGETFILEHKTAKSINSSYIDKLWSDFQIILYCYYVNKVYKIPCSGVFYNVIQKSNLDLKLEESDAEFRERYDAACKKNKSGKTSIVKKAGETVDEYETRLDELYSDSSMFYRETIYITKNQMKKIVSEVSEMTKAFLSCIARNKWYMNTDYCFRYGSPCEYFPICKSGENENVIDNSYTKKPRYELNLIEDTGVF